MHIVECCCECVECIVQQCTCLVLYCHAQKRKRKSSTPTHTFLAVAMGNDVVVWNITRGEKEVTLVS